MRVLMATMKLDIGGAETHIIELSKALSRRGIEVTIASNGGAYEAELKEAGIEHIKIPFHSKNPACMLKAYKALKNLIFEKKFDIVHAHARIPAFLCAILNKRYHFRFVTTAHWVFDTRFPYNLLTRWGERSLAVSDDIKKYLVDNYRTNPDNIRVTINGIDLDKFSKDTDCQSVKEEFNLTDDKTRIVYISRMDEDRSLVAHKLIAITESLSSKYENLEIIIVGGGNDFEKVKAEADAVNEKAGKRVIITTGSRTDINKFAALSHIFVGVSRAALEAMACEKPSIIAGNEGYIGIFDQDKLDISIKTNFCCRGCDQSTTEKLERDIDTLLTSSDEKLACLGEYSRETVKKYYSIDTMADDAIKMYISSIKDCLINEVDISEFDGIEDYLVINPLRFSGCSSDIVISGYYGFGNSGDDSILYAIIRELKILNPDIKIVTLSKTPKQTSSIYGVKAIGRFNLFSILLHLIKTKLLISGGGSLIQDVTSTKSLFYYLSIIRLASLCKNKVMLYANGIGPINNSYNANAINRVLNKVDLITLREPSSLEELKRFGVNSSNVKVTADPAFNLFSASDAEILYLLKKYNIPTDLKYCVVAVRPWKYAASDFSAQLAEATKYAKEKYNLNIVFLAMQPSNDTNLSCEIASLTGDGAYVICENLSPSQILGIIQKAEFVIAMRLHALIYAARYQTPEIAISYDPKIDSIMEYIGHTMQVPVWEPNPITLCRYIDNIMSSPSQSEDCQDFSALAKENAELALKLIK